MDVQEQVSIWEGSLWLQGGGQGQEDEVGLWVIQGKNEDSAFRWQSGCENVKIDQQELVH